MLANLEGQTLAQFAKLDPRDEAPLRGPLQARCAWETRL
jgi:hypothetical protein